MQKHSVVLIGLISVGMGLIIGYSLARKMHVSTPATDSHMMSMEESMGNMSQALTALSGEAFDQAFLREMIVHHAGAVEMAQQVLKKSSRTELRALAEDIITNQTKEIKIMQDWEKSWFHLESEE